MLWLHVFLWGVKIACLQRVHSSVVVNVYTFAMSLALSIEIVSIIDFGLFDINFRFWLIPYSDIEYCRKF